MVTKDIKVYFHCYRDLCDRRFGLNLVQWYDDDDGFRDISLILYLWFFSIGVTIGKKRGH